MLLFAVPSPPSMRRRASADQARNGVLGIVECDPFLDVASGLEAIADLFEIDCLLLQ